MIFDVSTWPSWLRQIAAGIALFVLGGVFAFVYSYWPLHAAEIRRIGQLETRIDALIGENVALEDEIRALRMEQETGVDPEALAQVEQQLEKTRAALQKAEKAADQSERRRREAASQATRWRERYETLRDTPAPAAREESPGSGSGSSADADGESGTSSPAASDSGLDARRVAPAGGHSEAESSDASSTSGEKGILGANTRPIAPSDS